jgi:hypothetical protein
MFSIDVEGLDGRRGKQGAIGTFFLYRAFFYFLFLLRQPALTPTLLARKREPGVDLQKKRALGMFRVLNGQFICNPSEILFHIY